MESTIGTDEKINDDSTVKDQILKSLFQRRVNLTDEQLAEVVGYSIPQVAELRKNAYRTGSMTEEHLPFSWDYVLCFTAGSDDVLRKPTSKEMKAHSQVGGPFEDEWTNGMNQKKYFSQIFQNIWKRLEDAKLSVKAYRSYDSTKMFLIVGITEQNLRYWADERDTDLQINPVEAVLDGRRRGFPLAQRTKLKDENEDSGRTLDIALWENLYIQYNPRANSQVYRKYDRVPGDPNTPTTIFDEKTRLRIIYESIIADSNEGGAEVTIHEYIANRNHPLKAVFPLHNQAELDEFERDWIRNWNLTELMWCPLDKIRAYFGEPVAFYFGFLSFYLHWLAAPSVLGLIFFIEQLSLGKIDAPAIQLMSLFIIFWSVAFIDFWVRQEARYRLKWGMTKFEQKAVARPQFRGEWEHDAVTGLWSEQFSFFQRGIRISSTLVLITIFLSGCIAAVISILLVRDSDPNDITLKIELGIANGVVIFVFDVLYSIGSRFGNDFENHRTEQDYQNAFITKSFIFKFFNSFASLFYLAFVRPAVNGKYYYLRYYSSVCSTCHSNSDLRIAKYLVSSLGYTIDYAKDKVSSSSIPDSDWKYCYTSFTYEGEVQEPACTITQVHKDINEAILGEVQIQLVTLFLTAIFIQNFLEVFIPFLVQYITDYRRKSRENQLSEPHPKRSEPEEQWELAPFSSTIDDMSELVIQFGYVTLFIVALPITPLLAFVNNVVEMKVDAVNVVKQGQRPNPDGSYGLGAWNSVLGFFSLISVGTNVAMMTWTTQVVYYVTGETANQWRWIFFSIVSIILALIIGFEKYMIPDVPEEVEQAIERQRLIENVLVLGANVDPDTDQAPENDEGDFAFNPAAEFVALESLEEIPNSDLGKANHSVA